MVVSGTVEHCVCPGLEENINVWLMLCFFSVSGSCRRGGWRWGGRNGRVGANGDLCRIYTFKVWVSCHGMSVGSSV